MRLLTSVAALALLAAPALAQTADPAAPPAGSGTMAPASPTTPAPMGTNPGSSTLAPAAPGGSAAASQANMRPISVSDLSDMDVKNLKGDELGEIEQVVRASDGKIFAVVEFGGFLGIGEQRKLVPVEALTTSAEDDDEVILPGVSEDQLRGYQSWTKDMAGYTVLGDNETLQVAAGSANPNSTGSTGTAPTR